MFIVLSCARLLAAEDDMNKLFNLPQSLTNTSSKFGNRKLLFPQWKLSRLGKSRSLKVSNWLKTISPLSAASPSPSFSTITCLICLHLEILISLSCTRLLAAEDDVNKLSNLPQSCTRLLAAEDDMNKLFNLPQSLTSTSSKFGNRKLLFPQWKLSRLGKSRSLKVSNWLKTISPLSAASPSPSPSFSTITCLICLHSEMLILLSCARLLAAEDDMNELFNLPQSLTVRVSKF
ncbi:hypothetical protein TorRG33x02_009650 [Trema orientale]|uniref:Uncharacterized protein n=1 Tax=Trema orientale TaxID=63057 RepID=A0A2P5FYQ4_TREOI|nr:hypothetical protein TorRG33x02_009650 [Trema orientale]